MIDDPKRPVLVLLTSHWVSLLGVALVTTAGFSWLFVLLMHFEDMQITPTSESSFSFLSRLSSSSA
jgi:hypothetical protein